MTDPRLRQLADRLLDARERKTRIAGESPATGPATLEEAYEVQRLVMAALGPVGAFKSGRQAPGDRPVMAPIAAAMVRRSPACFGPHELNLVGFELEVAFLVHGSLPDSQDPRFDERARLCVSPLAAIELLDCRLADRDAAGALWKFADNQVNGGLAHGEPAHSWSGIDLARVEARVEIGEETVASGPAVVPGGNAFDTFCAFAKAIGNHCGGLMPGQIVTTGMLNGVHFAEPGQRVTGHIAGLGSVSVEFAA